MYTKIRFTNCSNKQPVDVWCGNDEVLPRLRLVATAALTHTVEGVMIILTKMRRWSLCTSMRPRFALLCCIETAGLISVRLIIPMA